jgi:hypothetical protein
MDGEVVTQTPYKETREGLAAAHDRAMELEKLKQRNLREKAAQAARLRLLTATTKQKGPGADEEFEVPMYKPQRVEQLLEQAGLVSPEEREQEPTDYKLEEELRERIDARNPWWQAAEQQGMEVTQEERQAPPQVGQAMMYVRQAEKKYGGVGQIPSGVLTQIKRAYAIIDQYQGGGR